MLEEEDVTVGKLMVLWRIKNVALTPQPMRNVIVCDEEACETQCHSHGRSTSLLCDELIGGDEADNTEDNAEHQVIHKQTEPEEEEPTSIHCTVCKQRAGEQAGVLVDDACSALLIVAMRGEERTMHP